MVKFHFNYYKSTFASLMKRMLIEIVDGYEHRNDPNFKINLDDHDRLEYY